VAVADAVAFGIPPVPIAVSMDFTLVLMSFASAPDGMAPVMDETAADVSMLPSVL
jgi:hypothetical protein